MGIRSILIAALLAGAAAVCAEGPDSGAFSLKIFEGYQFSPQAVVKSGSAADLSFTYQVRRMGMISYLGAAKIKYFESRPAAGSIGKREIESWEDYVAGPSPGFYVIRARDGAHYLVHLQTFENQGKAAAYWKMSFRWEKWK
jgi:hypothetical protein